MHALLVVPYLLNIVILAPLLVALWAAPRHDASGPHAVGIGPLAFRDVTTSLWTAILLASVAGLFAPVAMWPILAVQVVYKGLFLVRARPWSAAARARLGVPCPMVAIFVGIVFAWPAFVALALSPS